MKHAAIAFLWLLGSPLHAGVTYTIDTYAGSDAMGDGGPAAAAQLVNAHGIVYDHQGNLYLADTDNHRVRKITPGGVISTLAGTGHPGFSGDGGPAGTAQLNSPYGLAVDSAGNIYVADFNNQRVRKISTDNSITTIAGTGDKSSAGDGGPALAAKLASPRNLVFDSAGNLYVSEFDGHRVRRIARDGTISTVAGTGTAGLNLDPKQISMSATAAQLSYPAGLAVDATDGIYIADSGNNLVRRVWGGSITTALDGRSNPAFLLYSPAGLAIDASGFLYITDSTAYVRKLAAGQLVSVAGTGEIGYSGDGGYAVAAKLTSPHDLAFDTGGNLYIADGCYVRKVTAGIISTLVGNGYAAVGDGLAASAAQLLSPQGVALDGNGSLYIADAGTQRIRRVDAHGLINTIAGNGQAGFSGDNGLATLAQFYSPGGVAVDSAANVYIADTKNNRVRRIPASGYLTTIAGNGTAAMGVDNQFAPLMPLNQPRAVALDPGGTLYIADTANHRIARITPSNTLVTFAGTGMAGWTGDNGLASHAQLNAPAAIAFDHQGDLYIADTFNHLIRKVTPAGVISTVAGTGAPGSSGDEGPATSATLNYPCGVTVDSSGLIYIADTWNHRIRMIDSGGVIHAVAGTGAPGYAGDRGSAAAAQLYFPTGIVVDNQGVVYFSDSFNNRVRRLMSQVTPAGPGQVVGLQMVNAASLQAGPVAPGEIVSIFSSGVGPDTGAGAQPGSGALPASLAQTQVFFDGIAAPLFYVQSAQINVQVPYSVSGTTQVEVFYQGVSRGKLSAQVASSAPGIYAGAILNQDATANTANNRATQGSVLTLFATGEGILTPAAVTGRAIQAPLPKPVLPVSLSIGGTLCEVLYAGSAPGLVGLLQVNVRVPGGLPSGALPVILTVGTAASQPGVTVAVK